MKSYESDSERNLDSTNLLTSPFGLAERLSPPRFRVDTIAFADLALICLITLLLCQSFIFSPGVTVDLPVLQSSESVIGVQADAVATVWDGKIVTNLGSYPLERMDTAFRDLMDNTKKEEGTLLLLSNRTTPFESIAEIFESARQAGFVQVQMAAKTQSTAP
ncbi:ExbD/TolR family protein [Puniceicoccus vermicola]|uniref:Biopolymer transporter ExbD n=1 Tax=Puniceicoccus vermicola TaxID=388746 RepID=A0A7X1AYJ2_9BACT|nr:biopolymer transporter ExbD [Puniceicoccus vermicola]MBC2602252.1 biopolymer transporter ExbD [Puniceicoccus vermicola]